MTVSLCDALRPGPSSGANSDQSAQQRTRVHRLEQGRSPLHSSS